MSFNTSEFAVQVLVSGVPSELSYGLHADCPPVEVGAQVTVEVGKREARGWVVDKLPLAEAVEKIGDGRRATGDGDTSKEQLGLFGEAPIADLRLKPVIDAYQAFQPEQLQLFKWMASYYGVSLVDVIESAIPRKSEARSQLGAKLTEEGIHKLSNDTEWFVKLGKRAPLQASILAMLSEYTSPLPTVELGSLGTSVRASLKSLEKKGLIELRYLSSFEFEMLKRETGKAPPAEFAGTEHETLTPNQQQAVDTLFSGIDSGEFFPTLLFGVTGSGKTEVYIQAIRKVVEQGKTALIIVPEISLTPQLLDQFQSRLSMPLGLLHSQVGSSARWTAWEALLRGNLRIAIGARSGVFAPVENLGLVIVDEEHEHTYKQSDGLRYHARDVAVMRAKYAKCPVILGSATPSFESLLNVKKKRYTLIEMPERVTSRPLPKIEIIDMKEFRKKDMISENLTPPLYEALQVVLKKKQQAIILYNRRGFSSFLQCATCSDTVSCPNCSVALTYHKRKNFLLCHYCNLTMQPPSHCSVCRDPKMTEVERDSEGNLLEREKVIEGVGALVHRGSGTEKVVDELGELFPEARIIRMDRDTVGQKGSYRKILGQMRKGEADILVGTQMIAKGHDIPGVTLVGVVDADVGLHLPDFRSSEKAFQLITQAAGRAGRGAEQGRVLVQTRQPSHPTIVATSTGRFKAFARYELEYREKLNYPPSGKLMRLVVSNTDRFRGEESVELVQKTLTEIIQQIVSAAPKSEGQTALTLSVLGPAPTPHERLRGRFRWHTLIKSNSSRSLSQLAASLNQWKSSVRIRDFRLTVDVDAVEML